MDRRKWFRQTGVLSTGLVLTPYLGSSNTYLSEEGEEVIKLSSNENPYGCSAKALKAYNSAGLHVNRYVFATISKVKDFFANKFNVTSNEVLLGAGSSSLLETIALFMLQKGGDIVTATPTFDIMPAMLQKFNIKTHYIPLNMSHVLDLDKMLLTTKQFPGLVYIVNPNNPIGTALDSEKLILFMEKATKHSYVLIDEAYLEFSDKPKSMIHLIYNPKVIIIKTLSKVYGLAGLRIGYGFAHEGTVKGIEKFQIFPGLTISSAAYAATMAALGDNEHIEFVKRKNNEAKSMVYKALEKLKINYISSQTSFILFDISSFKGDFVEEFKKRNILIGERNYLDKKWCRVSMGTIDETKKFIEVLEEIWG